MPGIHVNLYRLIDIGVVAINAGDMFLISERHTGGGRTASYIVKSIIEKSSRSGTLILEVPSSMQGANTEMVATHIEGSHGYSDGVETLPFIAEDRNWSLSCVDLEEQLNYSSQRQDFIANKIKNTIQSNLGRGSIVLYGWNHIAGKTSQRFGNVLSFKKYLTGNSFKGERVYLVKNIRAHVIGRREIRAQ